MPTARTQGQARSRTEEARPRQGSARREGPRRREAQEAVGPDTDGHQEGQRAGGRGVRRAVGGRRAAPSSTIRRSTCWGDSGAPGSSSRRCSRRRSARRGGSCAWRSMRRRPKRRGSGRQLLDAALAYVEATAGGPLAGPAADRVRAAPCPGDAEREGERVSRCRRASGGGGRPKATRAVTAKKGKTRAAPNPIEDVLGKALAGNTATKAVRATVRGGAATFSGVPVASIATFAKTLTSVKLPRPTRRRNHPPPRSSPRPPRASPASRSSAIPGRRRGHSWPSVRPFLPSARPFLAAGSAIPGRRLGHSWPSSRPFLAVVSAIPGRRLGHSCRRLPPIRRVSSGPGPRRSVPVAAGHECRRGTKARGRRSSLPMPRPPANPRVPSGESRPAAPGDSRPPPP
jgi:hypothetical protein